MVLFSTHVQPGKDSQGDIQKRKSHEEGDGDG